MVSPPVVTGVSPKEGPPGTRITIRGEFLGTQPRDLVGLFICGVDCLLSAEWKSPNKIFARSGSCKGTGSIIVFTKSGGEGTSLVKFRGYYETVGPLKESAVWVEETPMQNLLWSRRSMSPSSFQQEDPLGLSVETSDKKIPEDDLNELFPGCSGDMMSENFSPAWFLVENHHATSFNDLKAGYAFIKRKVEGQKVGQLSFLKKNVGFVVDQMDILIALREKYQKGLNASGTETYDVTHRTRKQVEELIELTNELFEDVLTRRDKADSTRTALSLLQRFRFLYIMPTVIDTNIKKGDYDLVINDYIRIKNLFGKTNVEVFKKILSEIDNRMVGFRDVMQVQLKRMPADLDEQKRLIAYLTSLDATYDFGWDAVIIHVDFLTQILTNIDTEYKMAREKTRTAAGKKGQESKMQGKNNKQLPPQVIHIENATEAMSVHFPDLWKIGRSYFSGDLHVEPNVDKQDEFKNLVLSVIETFDKLCRAIILSSDKNHPLRPDDESLALANWLPYCLQQLFNTHKTLKKLDLPDEAIKKVTELMSVMEIFSMTCLFKCTLDEIRLYYTQEDWTLHYVNKHGGITDLPNKFEKAIQVATQQIRENILSAETNLPLLVNSVTFTQEFEYSMDQLLTEIGKTYKTLAFTGDNTLYQSSNVSQVLGNSLIDSTNDTLTTDITTGPAGASFMYTSATDQPRTFERRLLIVLSNCQYTINYSLKKIANHLERYNYPPAILAIGTAEKNLSSLGKLLMESYLEQKCDPLVGTIEPSMYLGRFDWNMQSPATDISPYVKEILNNLIAVYDEVQEVSENLVERLLKLIIETIAEEISRLISCFGAFSESGAVQAYVDISALTQTLNEYCTDAAKNTFAEAIQVISPLNASQVTKANEILEKFNRNISLLAGCFKKSRS